MNTVKMNRMTSRQALNVALNDAGIENDEYRCLSSSCDNGFFHIMLWTPYLRYEFYVAADEGTVAGISTEPVPAEEALRFPGCGEENAPAAA